MMKAPKRRNSSLLLEEAWQALRDAAQAVTYKVDDETVHELRLQLRTPGLFALYKADIPTPGLPMLDGFLKFLAFRWALARVIQARTDLTSELLWQWNVALRDQRKWIEFPIPIREEKLSADITLYDCSIGLPVTQNGDILYPAGAFFACGNDFFTFPSEKMGPVDQIALRRRSVEPLYRPVELSAHLKTTLGSTKALDNRIYYAITHEYVFYLRGDKEGIEQLLNFAIQHDIGIGKKTTLGYGRINGFYFSYQPNKPVATLGHRLDMPGMAVIALLKNVPYQEIQRRCIREQSERVDMLKPDERVQNERLFGAREFALTSPIETFDCYRPPYWRREGRTQVLRYGTLLTRR
ncbi:MAG: hypothetical protein ACUVV0_13815 [Anaerolineae bacterium]